MNQASNTNNESLANGQADRHSYDPMTIIGILGVFGIFCWMFKDTFVALMDRWNNDSNYSHGYLVPVVSGYLAYNAYQTWKNNSLDSSKLKGGWIIATVLLVIGFTLRLLTVIAASLIGECIAMLAILSGLVVLLLGRTGFKLFWPALLFLSFMIPWPAPLYTRIAFPMQLFVSQISSVILETIGIPVLLDGNLIHLPGQIMHVAEACSGLRQLTAFLAICTCAALLMDRPMWYRLFLLISAAPIAISINILRVTATGVLLHNGYGDWTRGTLHTLEGLLMVALGLGCLILEISTIDWMLVDENKNAVQTA